MNGGRQMVYGRKGRDLKQSVERRKCENEVEKCGNVFFLLIRSNTLKEFR